MVRSERYEIGRFKWYNRKYFLCENSIQNSIFYLHGSLQGPRVVLITFCNANEDFEECSQEPISSNTKGSDLINRKIPL